MVQGYRFTPCTADTDVFALFLPLKQPQRVPAHTLLTFCFQEHALCFSLTCFLVFLTRHIPERRFASKQDVSVQFFSHLVWSGAMWSAKAMHHSLHPAPVGVLRDCQSDRRGLHMLCWLEMTHYRSCLQHHVIASLSNLCFLVGTNILAQFISL